MGRSPMQQGEESGVKKGPWTPEEDEKLINHIQKHGHGSWRALPTLAGLNRCGKSCRLRWTNYLRPDIKRGKFSQDEEQTILNLHAILGNKWSAIATHLPGRTDNEIKNFWNTHLKKKLIQMGFDPMTHRPRTDIFATLPQLLALANLFDNPNSSSSSSSSSWEDQAIRFQSEALQMARLNQCLQQLLQPSISIPNFHTSISDFNLSNLEAPPSFSAAQFLQLPELEEEAPCSVDQMVHQVSEFAGVVGQGENSPPSSSAWMKQSLSPPLSQGTEDCITNTVDASSYGAAAQMWSDLLDDPIFHDIP